MDNVLKSELPRKIDMKSFVLALIIVGYTLTACGKRSDRPMPQQVTSNFRLINSLDEPVFLNNSSELRCEALRQFLEAFAAENIQGAKVDQHSCLDMSGIDNRFVVRAQLVAGDKTSVIIQNIAGKAALETEFCDTPFDGSNFDNCASTPLFRVAGSETTTDGLLSPGLGSLRDALSAYVSQPQTKDLAYGIETSAFADQWVAKLDGTYTLTLPLSNDGVELKIKLVRAANGSRTGAAEIAEADLHSSKAFFGCTTTNCLVDRPYSYLFNGHHLILVTDDGQSLSISLTL
jgi:hypothetical protein